MRGWAYKEMQFSNCLRQSFWRPYKNLLKLICLVKYHVNSIWHKNYMFSCDRIVHGTYMTSRANSCSYSQRQSRDQSLWARHLFLSLRAFTFISANLEKAAMQHAWNSRMNTYNTQHAWWWPKKSRSCAACKKCGYVCVCVICWMWWS